jgi:hypothetical protein
MKLGAFLFALVVVGGVAATPGVAQQPRQAAARTVANPATASPVGPAPSRRGAIGGPVSKGAKINGTGLRSKH